MKAGEIYKKFNIPSNLSDHMLSVAGVVVFLREHWKESELDWNILIKSALLHDLGNIVKFNLENYPELLGGELKNVEYWKKVKAEVIEKYGSDDHEVTRKMLDEIGVEDKIKEIILNKSFGNAVQISDGVDWYPKILSYADGRILPNGLATLEERIADVKNRMPKYANRPDFGLLVEASMNVEKQIESNLDVSVSSITAEAVNKNKESLLDLDI